jgi:PHD/YefM family antitoxin component YafN of YafNO toxin-antitoxin module
MKLSLNSQQKSDFVLLDTLCFKLEETLKEWRQSKTMKSYGEALTDLDSAAAQINKGLRLILSQIDEAEVAALNRRKATNEIVLMPVSDYERLRKQQPELKHWLSKEQAYYLAEGVIEAFCRGCKREAGKCEIREIFIGWEIPGIEEYEECQYRE